MAPSSAAARTTYRLRPNSTGTHLPSCAPRYLEDTQAWGNIFKGWQGYLVNKGGAAAAAARDKKKPRRVKDSERLFSSSSLSAPQPSAGGHGDGSHASRGHHSAGSGSSKSSKSKHKSSASRSTGILGDRMKKKLAKR